MLRHPRPPVAAASDELSGVRYGALTAVGTPSRCSVAQRQRHAAAAWTAERRTACGPVTIVNVCSPPAAPLSHSPSAHLPPVSVPGRFATSRGLSGNICRAHPHICSRPSNGMPLLALIALVGLLAPSAAAGWPKLGGYTSWGEARSAALELASLVSVIRCSSAILRAIWQRQGLLSWASAEAQSSSLARRRSSPRRLWHVWRNGLDSREPPAPAPRRLLLLPFSGILRRAHRGALVAFAPCTCRRRRSAGACLPHGTCNMARRSIHARQRCAGDIVQCCARAHSMQHHSGGGRADAGWLAEQHLVVGCLDIWGFPLARFCRRRVSMPSRTAWTR